MTLTRRHVAAGLALAWAAPARAAADSLAALEAASGGRLGLCAVDIGSGRRLLHRADERFAFASTFKWLLAAHLLHLEDEGMLSLSEALPVRREDLVPYAPVVETHLARGSITIAQACAATVELSDNAAANLLLARTGGTAALTAWLRRQGDPLTRLDRIEPGLNENAPGDPRDTTTPAAMAGLMQRLLLGGVLRPASRERLLAWMQASPTGRRRLRAALPPDWRAGDKTGTGERGAIGNVAVVWPPGGAPWLVACYLSDSVAARPLLEDVHRRAMLAVREHFGA